MRPGDTVANYEVVSLLGEGGFAEVYRVRHRLLGSDHALKVLYEELLKHEEVRQRFLDEARLQARLKHPGIVAVTDLIAEPGVAGFVMEYIEGRTLAEELDALRAAKGSVSPARVREVFLPVLAAVQFAHAHGVVHRDLKPENILLPRDHEGRLTPKVADFGIAKVVGELRGARKTTRGSQTLGTIGYMSPEQVVSSRDVDARSDVFSVGVCVLEYATLDSPFQRDSEFETMKAIHEVDYTIPAWLEEQDPALVAVVRRALAKEPGERFGSAAEMAQALEGVEEEPREAAPKVAAAPTVLSPPAAVTAVRPAPVVVASPPQPEMPGSSLDVRLVRGGLGAGAGFFLGFLACGVGAIPASVVGFLLGFNWGQKKKSA